MAKSIDAGGRRDLELRLKRPPWQRTRIPRLRVLTMVPQLAAESVIFASSQEALASVSMERLCRWGSITSGDLDGILMIAVQALEKRTVEQEKQIARKGTTCNDLKLPLGLNEGFKGFHD